MGLLTTPGKTAISNGNPIRQYWSIWTPGSNAPTWASGYSENAIHGGSSSGESAVAPVVIDAGSRTQTAYNVALRDLGDLDAGEYTITVDVSNGKFNSDAGGYFRNGSYEADPQQCILRHEVYVVLDDGTNTSLSNWYGKISRFNVESFCHADGTLKQTVGSITARPVAVDTLERKITADDRTVVSFPVLDWDDDLHEMAYVDIENIAIDGTYTDDAYLRYFGWDLDVKAALIHGGDFEVIMEVDYWSEASDEWKMVTKNSPASYTSGSTASISITAAFTGMRTHGNPSKDSTISIFVYPETSSSEPLYGKPLNGRLVAKKNIPPFNWD
jgi:hypothetical protein